MMYQTVPTSSSGMICPLLMLAWVSTTPNNSSSDVM